MMRRARCPQMYCATIRPRPARPYPKTEDVAVYGELLP